VAVTDDDPKIFVDATQPATLHDGTVHTDFLTVQEAKIAWDRLPPVRQQSATISASGQVYTAEQINRLYAGPEPTAKPSAEAAAPLDPSTQVLSSIGIVHRVSAGPPAASITRAGRSTRSAGIAPAEITTEVPSIGRTNSAATIEVPAAGPLEVPRGIPPIAQQSLAASSAGIATGRAELTTSPAPADADPVERTLSDRPIPIANAARALAEELAAQIAELKQNKPNDPSRLAQYDSLIPFLEKLATGLGELADALNRLAAPGQHEPVLLGKAADTARRLQEAVTQWLETNRTMVIDVPVRLGLFGLGVGFVHLLGVDSTAVTAGLAYLAGLRSTPSVKQ
jgi:hypothetical protein